YPLAAQLPCQEVDSLDLLRCNALREVDRARDRGVYVPLNRRLHLDSHLRFYPVGCHEVTRQLLHVGDAGGAHVLPDERMKDLELPLAERLRPARVGESVDRLYAAGAAGQGRRRADRGDRRYGGGAYPFPHP